MKSRSGFTLIELMVVVIVISIIASIVVLAYDSQIKQARDNKSKVSLVNLTEALDEYYWETGSHPIACGHSSSPALGCNFAANMYAGATGIHLSKLVLPDLIKPTTTSAQLASILPALGDSFRHPLNSEGNPINRTASNVVQPDSFFLLSTDLIHFQAGLDYGCDKLDYGCIPPGGGGDITQSNQSQLAANDQSVLGAISEPVVSIRFAKPDGSEFSCNVRLTMTNPKGIVQRRSHQYALGYFSEEESIWKFFVQSPRDDLNNIDWNTTGTTACNAQDIGKLKD